MSKTSVYWLMPSKMFYSEPLIAWTSRAPPERNRRWVTPSTGVLRGHASWPHPLEEQKWMKKSNTKRMNWFWL
ncbi:hypothetical protein [Epibacterium ulvae]|uniref:hypothetical protein n=1 Tax=Epibacterium ulvae TaxID=1156985 RepID=UPI0024937306|nr:hypothetical protein [Epibacterium ulvae]